MKGMVIKSFNRHNSMDAAGAQAVWEDLDKSIDEIYKKNASKLSFEELYRKAYNLVLNKHAEMLYNNVKDKLSRNLENAVEERLADRPDEDLLRAIEEVWTDHVISSKMIRDILMYMDRAYATQHKKVGVYSLSLQIFREVIVYSESIRDRLRNIILTSIYEERCGQIIDRSLLRSILAMFVDLNVDGKNVYEEEFEQHFIESTRNFYREESQNFLNGNSCIEFVQKAQARLIEEANRVTNYLSSSTESKLRHIVEYEVITKHAQTLVEMENSGLEHMMNENKLNDLSLIYTLFSRVPSTLDHIRDFLYEHVNGLGVKIVADQLAVKDPIAFVNNVLELQSKYDNIIKTSFQGDKRALKKLKEAFENFLNRDNKCASYLATYIDDMFRSRLKSKSEAEAESMLDQIILIYQHLRDKDLFENYYRNHFARRLLNSSSVADELEETMIRKLKQESGYHFVSKLEGMIHDMGNSRAHMTEYRGTPSFAESSVELNVNVLTKGFWITKELPPCKLPKEVEKYQDAFSSFFLDKHQGQKLVWQHYLGTAEMRVNFPQGKKDLIVSTYQMCILRLFNEKDTHSLDEIRDATEIPEVELRRHLLSLCTPKLRILIKDSKTKHINPNDVFTFNAEFTSKFRKIKVPLIAATKENGEVEDGVNGDVGVPSNVQDDRKHQTEAAIVRILKARKVLAHNELISEVMRQLSSRFVPNNSFIKKVIESLIEREYLKRGLDTSSYEYLA